MEQPETPDEVLRPVQLSPRQHPSLSTSSPSNFRLANSEPSLEPPLTVDPTEDPTEDLTDSVLSLRFPKPAGNRQLTNWVSCSSPDIMQPGNVPDEDPSLTELGYDIIGTDGESQAESIASSFDYQKSDDIHSLAGTDVDTDSSDDEETTLNETMISEATVVDRTDHHDDAAEIEVLDILNQSLESPTSLPISSFSPFASLTYLDHFRTHEPHAVIGNQSSPVKGLSLLQQEILTGTVTVSEPESLGPQAPKTPRDYNAFRPALTYLRESRRTMAVLSGFFIIYVIGLVSRSVFSDVPIPKQLSTVPVASVPIVVTPTSITTRNSVKTPTSTISQTSSTLQTASSPNGLMFIPFGKEAAQVDAVSTRVTEAICSAELAGRDEILIRIPLNIKSSWLAKDAILIAVSRGLEDIPTKVSSVDEGILIQVPLREAYGMMAVTIATTYRPRVNEKLHVNFGAYRLSEALDAGKHLVREFAQRVVDTVNGTTSWVEDTYIPAFDIVSKQVCGQTASISDSVLHSLQDASGALLAIPSRLMAQLQPFLEVKLLLRRANQLRLEVAQESRNFRDELNMAILTSRINSKLLWLKMQGKLEERQEYLARAEMYLKEQHARVESARVERAERTKEQIRAWHERDQPVSQKGTLWNILGAWVGLEG